MLYVTKKDGLYGFFKILRPFVFVTLCSGSLLEERFDSQGNVFCFRKNSK